MTLGWMVLPVLACLMMAVALGYFGLHVLEREVIFVDLALAQVAALGATYAVFLGHEPDEGIAYTMGFAFTTVGALVFALARRFSDRVPQESLIGIAYVVCAASAAVMMDFAADPHGAEKLQHLMVGNVVWIRGSEVAVIAVVCTAVGLFHIASRKYFLQVTFDPDGAEAAGMRLWLWDLAFYLTLGMVITSLVHVAGVLLIFSYLIIPAVIARLFASGVGHRLLLGWGVAIPISMLGIASSYEHQAGPQIVVMLGLALVLALMAIAVREAENRLVSIGGIAGGVGAICALLYVFSIVEVAHDHDAAMHHDHVDATLHDDLPRDADASTREAWYRGHLTQSRALSAALSREEDLSLRLLLAVALAREGEERGLQVLAEIAASEVPFLRMEADDRLRAIAVDNAPAGDPLEGPVEGWNGWTAPANWRQSAGELALP